MLKTLQPNVIDEIMYHFLVVKKPICEDELIWFSRQEHQEPLHAATMRLSIEPNAAETELLSTDSTAEQPLASNGIKKSSGSPTSKRKRPRQAKRRVISSAKRRRNFP
ncbi:hypothetical protein [Paenibacillus hexagrammi]|uniref:Uncharacterized protein n=1 Tax=Paenibacillus hexagrammi TaxID=2908839 RepID=A0ABY3SQG8_9BACL|nr:hypothetical protein [Paenibacillus sp. YPD9-1]UJF35795.1 hypothetical protein L0M14_12325 [Paenibacillus sp. YPD9-1]